MARRGKIGAELGILVRTGPHERLTTPPRRYPGSARGRPVSDIATMRQQRTLRNRPSESIRPCSGNLREATTGANEKSCPSDAKRDRSLQAQSVFPRPLGQLACGNRLVEELGRLAVEDVTDIREEHQSLCGSDITEFCHVGRKAAAHVKACRTDQRCRNDAGDALLRSHPRGS